MTKIDSLHQEIDKKVFSLSPRTLEDFLNKTKIENTWSINSLIASLADFLKTKKIYSPLLKQNTNKDNVNFLKDKQLEEFSWEVLTVDIDLVWSNSSFNTKEIMWKVFALTNLFEEIYKDLWFKVFYVEWDRLIAGFFSNKNLEEKLDITKLYLTLIELYTSQKFHTNTFTWEKQSWDSIYAIFASYVANTINSKNFNEKFKQIKNANLPNYMDYNLTWIDIDIDIPWINFQLHKKYTTDKLKDILELDFSNEKVVKNAIIDLFLNNIQTNNEFRWIKQETIKKWEQLLKYWQQHNWLYLVLDGQVKLEILWKKENTKIVEAKTIIWEMWVNWLPANANVYTETDIKVIKIPRKIIEDILSWRKNSSTQSINQLKKLLQIYISQRTKENYIKDASLSAIISNFDSENEVKTIFTKLINSLKKEEKQVKKEVLTKEWENNSKLYLVKKWSKIAISKNGKTIYHLVASDMIVGENTFLSYLNWIQTAPANATFKILEWTYSEIGFQEAKKEIGKQAKIRKALETLKIQRANNTHIINPNLQKAA